MSAMTPPPVGAPDRRRRRSAGQALVEFALVVPLFVLLLAATFDGGRLVYMNTVLSQAAREAARVASVQASWVGSLDPACNRAGGPVCPADFATLLANADNAANRMIAPFGAIPLSDLQMSCDPDGAAPTGQWTGQTCAARDSGDVVSVRVRSTYSAVTPVFGQFVPPLELSGYATMIIN
jgi:hypothetical protein